MTGSRRAAILLVVLGIVVMSADSARSYAPYGYKWSSNVVMHLQLKGETGTLIDGATSWNQSAEWALAAWNPYIDQVQFRVVRESTSAIAAPNGITTCSGRRRCTGRSSEARSSR